MKSKQAARPGAAIDRVLDAWEGLMLRLMVRHAPEVTALDITMAQAKALYLVFASGELRMSELAARLGVTSSTATGQVDRLVELDLLERHADPRDRRQVVVTATPRAMASIDQMRELNLRRMRELLGRVEPTELATVERAINLLGAAMDADAAPTQPTNRIEGTRS
jgi:DNA-binding MarR family transcriptional regulator